MSSASHGPVSVMDADGDLLTSGRTMGGLAPRSSEEPARRAGEERSRRPPPVVETGDEVEPSSPQAEQLFRAKRGGSYPAERSQAVDEEHEPSHPAVMSAGERAAELENEPSSPQAEQLVRLKRAAAGSQTSSPGRSSNLGRASEEGEAGGGRQDANSSSMPITSDEEPSSPQAQQLFRIKRSAAGSQASSPASRREENELPSFDAEDAEPSSPQAEQLLRIRRAGAGSQSTSPAPSRQAHEDSMEAEDTSEPNSPVRQRRKPGARGAPEPSRPQIAAGRERQAGQDNESRLLDVQQGRGEIQSRSSEGCGQDELDALSAVWRDTGREDEEEEVSSPSATRLLQAKRAQHSRGLEWGEAQSSPEHSVSSVHEEEMRPYLPNDDEPCSPQADSMQRIKAGAARRRQMSPAAEVDRQVDQRTQVRLDVHQQGGKPNHSRDVYGDMHQAQWQNGSILPVYSAGASSGGMLQGELDRICVEAGEESSLSEPSSPGAQLLLRAKHSKSAHSSPGSVLDTSDGEIGRVTTGSVGSAQSMTRKPVSSGSPLALCSSQGISQDELDNLSRSIHAPSGEEPWQAEEPNSPQADQLRRVKAQARQTGSGSSGRREESSAEMHHGVANAAGVTSASQHLTSRDGFTQNELDSLSRSSPISVGDADEVSSPTATQLRRAKRTAQQASRQAELSVPEFVESVGLEASGNYEAEHQEEPSSPCAAQIRRAKKIAQSQSGSPASTAYQEDSSPGSAPAFERRPQGGITQAELDAFSQSHSVGEEEQRQGEVPSSPSAQQLRRSKRQGGTPPRVGWAQDSNRQPELTQLPSDRFHGGMDDFGSASDGHLLFSSVPEHSGSEDTWLTDDGPSSPQAQKHLRAKRVAQQNRGLISHSGGEDPWRESRPEPPEAWPCHGASSSVGASSQSQFRTVPSPPVQSYGAGLTQAELDSLGNHSPAHSTSPNERGTRRAEPDVGRPASSRSEIPPPPIQSSAGLSQAELNALCQEPRLPGHSARLGGAGDEEPESPQASRMQQIRRAQQYAPVGGAPWV